MAALNMPDDSNYRGQLLLIILSIVFMVATALAIGFRVYSRLYISRTLFVEDFLIVGGTVFAFGLSSAYVLAAFYGYGQHTSHVLARPSDFILVFKVSFAISFLYFTSNFLIKVSFLALYLRLDSRRPMRWIAFGLMSVEFGQFIAAIIVLSLNWESPDVVLSGGGLENKPYLGLASVQYFWDANGIITAVTSAAIYSTPLFMLHGLDISRRQKFAVGALFGLGFFSMIASCIKTYYMWSYLGSSDLYYTITDSGIWTQVEIHLAIICGSAQTFKILLKGFCPSCCQNQSSSDFYADTTSNSDFPAPRGFAVPLSIQSTRSLPTLSSGNHSYNTHRLPSLLLRPGSNSWKDWEMTIAQLPQQSYTRARERLPPARPTELRRSHTVATVPVTIQTRIPSIASRLEGDGVNNLWLFEAATDGGYRQPWPLPEPR